MLRRRAAQPTAGRGVRDRETRRRDRRPRRASSVLEPVPRLATAEATMRSAATAATSKTQARHDWAAMLTRVPGPPESPLRQALQFANDQYAFLERCWKRHGDVFTFRIPGE